MMILSFLWVRCGVRIGSFRRRRPSSELLSPTEWRWCDPPDDRGGVAGNIGWERMNCVVGSPNLMFRTAFSRTESFAHGLPGCPY